MVLNLGILFFREILQIDKFEGADFNMTIGFFEILAQKQPNKASLVPNFAFLFPHKILQLGKFESADCKLDNSFLKF